MRNHCLLLLYVDINPYLGAITPCSGGVGFAFGIRIRKLVNPEIIDYMVLSLEHGEHFSNRAREITHTICYANGHTNQLFLG